MVKFDAIEKMTYADKHISVTFMSLMFLKGERTGGLCRNVKQIVVAEMLT